MGSDAPDQLTIPTDMWRLRWLSLATDRDPVSPDQRRESVERVLERWPSTPSRLLALAAEAHGLGEHLGRLLDLGPSLLPGVDAAPDRESDEARTALLGALVRAEQLDYATFESDGGIEMVLRDALTDPDDLATIGAKSRWQALLHLRVSTPDLSLRRWSALAAKPELWKTIDIAEWDNDLDSRSSLQAYAALLSWKGLSQWREHIEPVDEAFRAATTRIDTPLVLSDLRPGEWWRYRVPLRDGETFRESALASTTRRYVGDPDPRSRNGRLRTISHVWGLADRPDGLRVMMERELDYWIDFVGRQARGEAERYGPGGWTKRHEAAAEERARRGTG
jgi:hypothetical protein